MIAVDTNLLIYAHRGDAEHHDRVKEKLVALAESPAPWCIPWPCVHEFLAVVTRSRYFDPPSAATQAF